MIRARIRVDGRLAAVCRRFWGRRWRPTMAVVSEMAGDAEYAARFPGNAGQPAAPAPAAAGQPPRQADPAAPLCNRCGVNRVNRRRNGSWFPTCFSCN